jgi:UDP-glucuronate 4-epimerase
MKIAITGGLGFIGSHVVNQCLEKNYTIIIINRIHNSTSLDNLGYLREKWNDKMPKLYIGDITNKKWLEKVFKEENPDFIIHLAALAGVRRSMTIPNEYIDCNIKGTLHILEIIRDWRPSCKLIMASSSTVHSHPIKSIYALTKKMTEDMASLFHELYDLDVMCLRFFSVYGDRCRDDLFIGKILKCIKEPIHYPKLQIYGNGTDIARDFTFIEDTVQAILKSLQSTWKGFHTIDIGTGQPYNLIQVLEIFRPFVPESIQVEFIDGYKEDQKLSKANTQIAEQILDYKSRFNLNHAIEKMKELNIF